MGWAGRLFMYPFEGRYSVSITDGDKERLRKEEFLNDSLIEFYLKYLQLKQDSGLDPASTFVFNTFFYAKLSGGEDVTRATRKEAIEAGYASVRSWTAKDDIFKKKFVVVPINEACHWYLAIIYNLGALIGKPVQVPASASEPLQQAESERESESEPDPPSLLDRISKPASRLARRSQAAMTVSTSSTSKPVPANDFFDISIRDPSAPPKIRHRDSITGRHKPAVFGDSPLTGRQDQAVDLLSDNAVIDLAGLSHTGHPLDKDVDAGAAGEDMTIAGTNASKRRRTSDASGGLSAKDAIHLSDDWPNMDATHGGSSSNANDTPAKRTRTDEADGTDVAKTATAMERHALDSDELFVAEAQAGNDDAGLPSASVSALDVACDVTFGEATDSTVDDDSVVSQEFDMDSLIAAEITRPPTPEIGGPAVNETLAADAADMVVSEGGHEFADPAVAAVAAVSSPDPRDRSPESMELFETEPSSPMPAKPAPTFMSGRNLRPALGTKGLLKLGSSAARRRGDQRLLERALAAEAKLQDSLQRCHVIMMDSLGGTHKNAMDTLKKYLVFEAADKHGVEVDTSDIAGTNAKVPSQPNHWDCGIYVLQFVETFFSDPDKYLRLVLGRSASITGGSASSSSSSNEWFPTGVVMKKRGEISGLIDRLSEEYRAIKAQRADADADADGGAGIGGGDASAAVGPDDETDDDDLMIMDAPPPLSSSSSSTATTSRLIGRRT
ncbi:hypothetical protein BC831DRAFT_189961 [Entophlyctis helioformis]|nr:hypothetical protein BC831DRAFT_189961 [Entophlyctis helioformis]